MSDKPPDASPSVSELAREVWEDESPAVGTSPTTETESGGISTNIIPGDDAHDTPGWRQEWDSLGPMYVRQDKYWGAHTQRSLQYFKIGTSRMPLPLIHAYGAIKAACAHTNAELGVIPSWKASVISQVALEIEQGQLDDHFPVGVYTSGSGTHVNANVNEVIANRANEILDQPMGQRLPIHPLDDVNRSQSSNDTFISALHIALLRQLDELVIQVEHLIEELNHKSSEWRTTMKVGRTHVMDATELSVGDEWLAFRASIARALNQITSASDGLHELAIGGTAVGNGINTPSGFRDEVLKALTARCGRRFRVPADPFSAQSTIDSVLAVHGALRQLATALFKIANDVRWLASGPVGGLNELIIPVNEPGSTVMPGKTNPTQCEAAMMACLRVMGNDVTMGHIAAEGNFQLNNFRPLGAFMALESTQLLADAAGSFATNLVHGTSLNRKRIHEYRERAVMRLTVLTPVLGYDRVARIAKRALDEGHSLRSAALEDGVEPDLLVLLDVPQD
jgi:fumarate hydratase, class II